MKWKSSNDKSILKVIERKDHEDEVKVGRRCDNVSLDRRYDDGFTRKLMFLHTCSKKKQFKKRVTDGN